MAEISETTPVAKPMIAPGKIAAVCTKVSKLALTVVTLAAELAIVAVVGATIGNYMSAKTIVTDCQRVALAKVGDFYIQCSVVEPKKDAPTAPPR